jgi:hypothetical protein
MNPTPFPAPQKSGGNYFLGLGLGLIPLALFLATFVTLSVIPNCILPKLFYASLVLEVVVLIVAIVFLFIDSLRLTGYGLLTAALVSPVVAFIGCVVMLSGFRTY